jgi:hypothetical protein
VRHHRVRFVQPYLRVWQMAIMRRLMLDSWVVDIMSQLPTHWT